MPRISVWFLRAALVYLLLGFTFGALLLWHKGVPISPHIWRLLPAHMEFLLAGWILLLTQGVVFWILPRFQGERPRPWLVWAAFVLLNLGVVLVGAAPFLSAPATVRLVGRVFEVLAVVSMAIHVWPRIKPAGA